MHWVIFQILWVLSLSSDLSSFLGIKYINFVLLNNFYWKQVRELTFPMVLNSGCSYLNNGILWCSIQNLFHMQMNMNIFFSLTGGEDIFPFNILIICLVLILNRPKQKATFINLGKLDPTVLFTSYQLICHAKFWWCPYLYCDSRAFSSFPPPHPILLRRVNEWLGGYLAAGQGQQTQF